MKRNIRSFLRKFIKGQKGQALPIVLILMILGGLLIPPTLNYASTSLKASQSGERILKERYAADAAAEYAIWMLSNNETLRDEVNALDPDTTDFISLELPPGEEINGIRPTCAINWSLMESITGMDNKGWRCACRPLWPLNCKWRWTDNSIFEDAGTTFKELLAEYFGLDVTSGMIKDDEWEHFTHTMTIRNKEDSTAVDLVSIGFEDAESYYCNYMNFTLMYDNGELISLPPVQWETEGNATTLLWFFPEGSRPKLEKSGDDKDTVELTFNLDRNPETWPPGSGEPYHCWWRSGDYTTLYGECTDRASASATEIEPHLRYILRTRVYDTYVYNEDNQLKLKARMIYWDDAFPQLELEYCESCEDFICIFLHPSDFAKCLAKTILLPVLKAIVGGTLGSGTDIAAWDYQ